MVHCCSTSVLACIVVLFFGLYQVVVGPPVTQSKGSTNATSQNDTQWDLKIEYQRYLKEVVEALESDEDFRKKLETADINDIKSGKIAKELDMVGHHIRTKLDELKRQEVERIRHLAIQEYEYSKGIEKKRLKMPSHIDPRNPHTFEIEDLRKLIVQTTKDLEAADVERRDEFKDYEMKKEFERQQELKKLSEEEKKQAELKHQQEMKKHQEHEKLLHPGSKAQLEEVWEEQDHMNQEFDPKTFFYLHDLDGNGVWDETELKVLFKKELNKMYDPNAPEDDMREREEDMERMREHVFNESDTNRDKLISYEEFLEQTKKQEFQQDEGWQGLDEKPAYTQEEYEAYERQRQHEIQQMIQQGIIPPEHYAEGAIGGEHHQVPMQQGHQQFVPLHSQGQAYVPPQHNPAYQVPPAAYSPNDVRYQGGQPQHDQLVNALPAHQQKIQAVPQPPQAPHHGVPVLAASAAQPQVNNAVPVVQQTNNAAPLPQQAVLSHADKQQQAASGRKQSAEAVQAPVEQPGGSEQRRVVQQV